MDNLVVDIEEIMKIKNVWIYGVGNIGRRIYQNLSCFDVKITGFVVSSIKDNIDRYMNIEVYEFSAIEFSKNDIIIVAAEGRAKEEIVHQIEKCNVRYIIWDSNILNQLWKKSEYSFEDRVLGKNKLCLVLAGYKNYLWENIFGRLKAYLPNDVEVCICSAGKYDDELSDIAKINNWSYLSTCKNSVSYIQNICISLYGDVQWVIKMDEDMFITQYAFEKMYETACDVIKSSEFDFGICSPLIPVNGIGYRYILDRYDLLRDYEEKFGKAIIGGASDREIEKNPETAKYMWGNDKMPHIDELAKQLNGDSGYQVCSTRLSIGCILFQRDLWEKMQGFVVHGNMDLGIDEEDIVSYCINNSKVIVMTKNSIVGHFGFGRQTKEMKQFYDENMNRF